MRTLEKYGLFGLGLVTLVLILACGGGGGGGGGSITDTTAPTISALAVSPSLLTVGTQAQINATVVDAESGVQAVVAVVTYPDNTQTSVTLIASGDGSTYTGRFNAQWTPSGAGANARVRLRAVDRAGNEAQQETTLRTAGLPPSPPF